MEKASFRSKLAGYTALWLAVGLKLWFIILKCLSETVMFLLWQWSLMAEYKGFVIGIFVRNKIPCVINSRLELSDSAINNVLDIIRAQTWKWINNWWTKVVYVYV